MKISKKIVSVLLSMLMMLSVISGLNFNAFAYTYDDEAVSGLFAARYSKYQVFDVQRSPIYPGGTQANPSEFTVKTFRTPYGMPTTETDDGWFYFKGVGSAAENGISYGTLWRCADEGLDPYIVELWYNDNHGTNVKCSTGVIGGIGTEGFFYEGDSHWGYYFSNNHAYEYNSSLSVTYTPVQNGRVVVSREVLNNYEAGSMLFPDGYYNVTFEPGEGSGTAYTYGAKSVTFANPNAFTAPAGKVFDYWENNTNKYYVGDKMNLSNDATFVAHWVNGVTVTFDSDGGTPVASQTIKPNTTVNAKEIRTIKDGFRLKAWQLNGVDFDLSTPVTENITLTAVWEKSNAVFELDAEYGDMPSGWTIESSNSDLKWTVGVGDYDESTGTHSGDYNFKCTHIDRGEYAYLVSPTLDLSSEGATLEFWFINRAWGGDIDIFDVCYRVSNGEWVSIFSTDGNSNEVWTEESINLPEEALVPDVQIGFKMTDSYGFGVGLDDVTLSAVSSAPAPTGEAAIGNVGYPTLEEALAAAQTGDTVTLLQDIDYSTTYTERNARDNGREHIIDLKDCTLDLNGYTISTINATVEFCGNGATIENGTFNLIPKNTDGSYKEGSYALIIDNSGTGNYGANGKITVNNVVCNGAVNVKQATVELNNVTARTTPTKFYAVWAEDYATVTINSGTYTDAQSGGRGVLATGTSSGETGAVIEVKGGTFEASNKIVAGAEENSILISGGTFSKPVAQKYCANGYIPVTEPNTQGKYEVTKADNGVSITVDSTIDTNFYIDNSYPSTAYVKTVYNKNSNATETANFTTEIKSITSLDVAGAGSGDYAGDYTLSVTQAPAQITEAVTIEVYASQADAQSGTNALYTKEYNAASYCNDILAGDYDAELQTLAQATLDYGAAAKDYFNYSATSAASDYESRLAGVTPSGVTPQTADILTGAALVVVADPQIKLFTNGPVAVNSSTNATAAADVSGDKNFIRVTGIAPANFGQTFTVNTSAGEISMSMNTILVMMAGNANMEMLAKGMYNYGTAAAAYFAG